ncbi:hypothetical protein BB559_007545 [Furculomyces boomerangus]|uniref:Peptidyl-prolyl isomerase CWC27 n=1 Tax=Furculomyces boomerangus TaxID=61424 RepID=A0A2T9XWZ7_9FUNG|nr:hypothetical protein BB559_007545 [Furculomyces boomerangus]
MSNIYILEPQTKGKVILKTTAGDLEIELWPKEAPKASRNFVQLCMEGYYNNTIFHRVVPGFVVQGGDPTGTGEGGESIYGEPFQNEIHPRLRFSRRGLLGMANNGDGENGSQFFITLGPTPELQNLHTIFGTIVGDTVFNALKLAEGEVDKETERPLYPRKIVSAKILVNPFEDIVPRTLASEREIVNIKKEPGKVLTVNKKKRVKPNKSLLSFEDDLDGTESQESIKKKAKSIYDMYNNSETSKDLNKESNEKLEPEKEIEPVSVANKSIDITNTKDTKNKVTIKKVEIPRDDLESNLEKNVQSDKELKDNSKETNEESLADIKTKLDERINSRRLEKKSNKQTTTVKQDTDTQKASIGKQLLSEQIENFKESALKSESVHRFEDYVVIDPREQQKSFKTKKVNTKL